MSAPARPLSPLARIVAYQAERFPLLRTSALLAAFASASVNVSALLAGRPLPGAGAYVAAFGIALVLFFHLRVLDEIKDAEIDRLHRPERPIPRGLVTLSQVKAAGLLAAPVAALLALSVDPTLLAALAAAWAFMGLMTAHFFAPRLLHASLLLTLLSHMLIMPLVDLVATGAEWAPHGAGPPAGLWIFLALSFSNGCVLEIGRKTWAPQNERPHVESYSSAWGRGRAIGAWCGFLAASALLLLLLGARLDVPAIGWTATAAALAAGCVALAFLRSPTPKRQAALDAASGLWILVSYLAAGYLPLLA